MAFLFVYGTLKRGYHNHQVYMHGARFLGTARLYGYTLLIDGIPFAIPARPECFVEGELYDIPRQRLRAIDALEGHPRYYRRVLETVSFGGQAVKAYVYIYPHPRLDFCLDSRWPKT